MSAIQNKTFLVLTTNQLHWFLNMVLILISKLQAANKQRFPTAARHSEESQLRLERIVRNSRRT